jgi:uncharacterized membrane protein YdjX (TVP38/TMEM64 family)
MPALTPAPRKKLLFRLGVALVVAAAAGIFLLKGVNLLNLLDRGVALLASVGPWAFFIAMALLPAVGMPATFFTLSAGSAFGPELGMAGVVAAGVAATAANIALTYWLARGLFRQWLEQLLERLGYKMPEVESADVTDLIIILRTTPGIPLCVQNYLLGLADAPVGRYLAVSYAIALPTTAAYLWFGDALRHGKGARILLALLLIVAAVTATHILRRHYGRRKAAAA